MMRESRSKSICPGRCDTVIMLKFLLIEFSVGMNLQDHPATGIPFSCKDMCLH
jgi:hypothetical protein